eukprot:2688285-Ditylum_brightwellii.AAC.1
MVTHLEQRREQGDRLILCMDGNDHIYNKVLGKELTKSEGLNMKEVVRNFVGEKLGATFFEGSKPINTV